MSNHGIKEAIKIFHFRVKAAPAIHLAHVSEALCVKFAYVENVLHASCSRHIRLHSTLTPKIHYRNAWLCVAILLIWSWANGFAHKPHYLTRAHTYFPINELHLRFQSAKYITTQTHLYPFYPTIYKESHLFLRIICSMFVSKFWWAIRKWRCWLLKYIKNEQI